MTIELPQHELLISLVKAEGPDLYLRLVHEYKPDLSEASEVLCLEMRDPEEMNSTFQSLTNILSNREAVFLRRSTDGLRIQLQSGEELVVVCREIAVREEKYNSEELREIAAHFHSLYSEEYLALVHAVSAVSSTRALISEQLRRIETKSKSYAAGTTAATLYSQQIRVLSRIYEELEPNPSLQGRRP